MRLSGQKKHQLDFNEIVAFYKNRIYNTCLGFVKNPQDAEDLAQEVFIEVYRQLGSFRGEAEIGTWLYRIAVNKSLEFLRRQSRQKRKGQLPEKQDNFDHPGISLENKERAAILFRAIEQLPEAQRVAFTLQKVEGLSVVEVSKVMKKSTSSVESLLFRARENLKKELKSYYEKNELA